MATKTLPQACGCGNALAPGARKYCVECRAQVRKADRHKPRKDPRSGDRHKARPRAERHRFAGVDGESVNGRYTLLAAASDDGWSDFVEARTGALTTRQCLSFLCSIPKGTRCWGFAFGYDVNMMLGDVPLRLVTRLYENGSMYWKEFRVAYVPGKKLTVSKYRGKTLIASTTVWDAFTWMQSSFVRWIEQWRLAPAKDIERIRTMKSLRSTFTDEQRLKIRRYCIDECRYLAAGARRLVKLTADAGIEGVTTWYSPATISKALLKREGVPEHRGEIPDAIVNPIEYAYHGGRAEVSTIGPIEGPLWQYDIRSAYPSHAITLPCLACGRWRHAPAGRVTPWSLVRVSWRPRRGHSDPVWGPLPVRPRTGSLRWPTHGTGWYWGVEVLAAQRHAQIDVKDAWHFVVGCEHRPFDYLRDLYAARRAMKDAGNAAEFVLKLALNATYGALAEHPHKHQRSEPKYRSLAWAGWITAATRAQLLDALTDDVVLMATDSLVSRAELPLTLGAELGEWEVEHFDRMFLAGTGIYWGEHGGVWEKTKTRGFEPGQLTREAMTELWERDGRTGHVTFKRQRFIGMGTALHRVNGFYPPHARLWRKFITEPCDKSLDLEPRRRWLTDDVHDGRTIAPTLALHKATERADRERIMRLRAEYADLERRRDKAIAELEIPDRVSRSDAVNKRTAARRFLNEQFVLGVEQRLLLTAAKIESAEHGMTALFSWSDEPGL